MSRPMLVLLAGHCAVIAVAVILFMLGHREAAFLTSLGGEASWTATVLSWIVLFDSRRRWPRASAMQRLANVLTFRMD